MDSDGIMRCPVCRTETGTSFFEASDVPVHCNVLLRSREEALSAARGDLSLVCCPECSHVFNAVFDPARADYSGAYENSLHYSAAFRDYAHQSAAALINRHELHGKTIVEIGCGDAYFLGLLCADGHNRGIGFEPRLGDLLKSSSVSVIHDYYSDKYSDVSGDLVCCRQVLEHIPDPVRFLKVIRNALGKRSHAVAFLEVPNFDCIMREERIWDVIYEHYSYFTSRSLRRAFVHAGLRVTGVTEAFAGQYLCVEGHCAGSNGAAMEEHHFATTQEGDVERFAAGAEQKIREWRSFLDQARSSGKRLAIWGAGSKGVMFLNFLQASGEVRAVVDQNPRKQGMYVAGTGHRIVAPDALVGEGDWTILLMNPFYEREVRGTLEALGVRAELKSV